MKLSFKSLLVGVAAAAAVAVAPAHAATFFNTLDGSGKVVGTSAVFGNDDPASPNFDDSFVFAFDLDGRVFADITSIRASLASDVNFTSVTLNGVEFQISSTGTRESRFILNQPVLKDGNNILRVIGESGVDGKYSGTISFAAVPEPGTWAMMIGGFGLAGFALRRRAVVATA
jgi:hypothetical protein